jgi:uroporphyrinogen-III synthase
MGMAATAPPPGGSDDGLDDKSENASDVSAGQPLRGWRVLVTRPAEQASPLAAALATAGATPVFYPTIALGPPPSWDAFDRALAALPSYAWLVLTSPSAARFALDRAPALAGALAAPGAPAVAAVGRETARALAARGVPVAMVPDDQRQEGLVASFGDLAPGTRVLFPQAIGGRELLRDALVARGASVDVVPVSQTRPLPLAEGPPPFDAAIFASPSALRAYAAGRGAASLSGKVVAVIGPTTRAAAEEEGLTVDVMPAVPAVTDLLAALAAYRRRR